MKYAAACVTITTCQNLEDLPCLEKWFNVQGRASPNLSRKFTNLPHGFIYIPGWTSRDHSGQGHPHNTFKLAAQKIDGKGLALKLEKNHRFKRHKTLAVLQALFVEHSITGRGFPFSRCPQLHVPAVRTFHQRTPRHCQSPTW